MTRSCSSWLSVGDSPVVPTGHEAVRAGGDLELDLLAERVVIDLAVRNGVTIATDRPANASPLVFINRAASRFPNEWPV